MTRDQRGAATIILAREEGDVCRRCYGHALNIAVGDGVRQCEKYSVTPWIPHMKYPNGRC